MMRVSGFASGMDIDDIVSKMVQAERVPLDKLNQKKQYTEWQRDDYRSLNAALLEFDTLIFNGVGKESSFVKKAVSISNESAMSVKSTSATSDFSGTMVIKNLATAATMQSNGATSITDPTAKLLSAGEPEQTLKIQSINKNGVLGNEIEVKITADDTLDSLIKKINSTTDVTAFYDQNSGKMSITSKYSGDVASGSEIILTGDFFTNSLKLDTNNELAAAANRGTEGQNATVAYNGMEINRNLNTFTINGAEFTLKTANPNETINFSSKADVDAILDTVTQFVSKYNELIEKIKDKTSETKYRDFPPLTSEQRKAMSEEDIKLWEEKAKSGTLRNDSNLNSLLTSMRTSLYTSVSSLTGVKDLNQIGITTSKNYMDGGKLTINENKLREQISENPDAIYKLFMANGDAKEDMGLARRLREDLKGAMKNITDKAGKVGYVNNNFSIGKALDSMDDRISTFEQKLVRLETRYYRQFTAMEQAIQKANNQSTSLMQYFS